MPAAPVDSPDPLYYLNNFRRALGWITERSEDLLDARERDFVQEFHRLPDTSAALLVRMLMRKGPLFRSSRLSYAEVGCPIAAAEPLTERGWLALDPSLGLETLFGLMTRPELTGVFGRQASSAGMRKAQWLDTLIAERGDTALPYSGWHEQAPDVLFSLDIAPLCERLRLVFFGNLHQDWSEFVLADLGIFRYESVVFGAASRAFRHRGDVDVYLAIHACRQRVDEDVQAAQLIEAAESARSDNPWLESRRAKLLFRIGERCERQGQWDDALAAYRHCAYPGARHRRVRVLERSGQPGRAFDLALEASCQPESEAESERMARALARLKRQLGHSPQARSTTAPVVPIDLVLPHPPDGMTVEYAVRDHLAQDGAPVHYVENALINSLFGLLCWEAVFAPLPGAFFHPFQRGPADLGSPDFCSRRAALFDACLAQLDSEQYRETMRRHFVLKAGLQSPFVSWGLITEELLELALDCIPAEHLKRCFQRLLHDLPANRNGLPDLIRFWPAARRYEMIEVKGPGDRLQDNQTRWLRYCTEHGMAVSVCRVRWAEAA